MKRRDILKRVQSNELDPTEAATLLSHSPDDVSYLIPVWEREPVADPPLARADIRSVLAIGPPEDVDEFRAGLAQAGQDPDRIRWMRLIPSDGSEEGDVERDVLTAQDRVRFAELMTDQGDWPSHVVWFAADEDLVPQATVAPLFRLTRDLLKQASGRTVRMVIVSRRGSASPRPGFAMVGGLARSLALENPGFYYALLTVEPTWDVVRQWDAVVQELTQTGVADSEIRRLDAGRTVRRFCAADPSAVAGPTPSRNGIYLITGGGGGLGLLLARHVIECWGGKVALVGRSPLGPELTGVLAELDSSGTATRYIAADVSEPSEARRVVAEVKQHFGALHGVIHAAGIIDDALLWNKTLTDFLRVLAPKVRGALALDEATQHEALDFFALYSSMVSVTGNAGQCDYAAANAFLDEFAGYREGLREKGERSGATVSINWPLWKDGVLSPSEEATEQLARKTGLTSLSRESGIAAFEFALRCGNSQLLVVPADTDTALRLVTPSLEERTAGEREPLLPSSSDIENPPLEAAEALVRQTLSDVLDIDPVRIRSEIPFEQFGIDSILVMRLTVALEERLGRLSKTLFFEYRNVRELAEHLAREFGPRLRPSGGTPADFAARLPVPNASDPGPPNPVRKRFRTLAGSDPARPGDRRAGGDIAIVGVSGRYPMAANLAAFWRNLSEGRDCVTEIPPDRWDVRDFFDPRGERDGTSYSKWGGFLDGVDRFDPLFFHISPRDARIMDPQERLFLEVAYQTLEDAGYTPAGLGGTEEGKTFRAVGVFVGVMYGSYQLYAAEEVARGNPVLAGSPYFSIANRVSYSFDFHGPSMAVDTACSSSLVAIHLACESIRTGECRMALAGGVNLSLHPYKYVQLSAGKFASTDGRCRSFGAGGDGYVPGEGVGAVFLKPLSDAIAAGDYIYGVVKASAVNHGGKTNGYSVPDPNAHADVIRHALKRADIDPRSITYVEAHGTGTALGDPIEIQGLAKAFGHLNGRAPWCALGSVKSNIGHLEAASGLAGLTKVLLQMKHGMLVPSLHAEQINPNISLEDVPFRVQRDAEPWNRLTAEGPDPGVWPRRAGISSFGAGGANAHLVVEEYACEPAERTPHHSGALILLSAKSADRLRAKVADLSMYVAEATEPIAWDDVAYTLQTGREEMEHRFAFVAEPGVDVRTILDGFVESGSVGPSGYMGQVEAGEELLEEGLESADYLRNLWLNGKLNQLARLWVAGERIPWESLYLGRSLRRVPLPGYPFAGKKYWISQTAGAAQGARPLHPLLDVVLPSLDGVVYRKTFRESEPVLDDHRLQTVPVVPAVAYLEMARAAADGLGEQRVTQIRRAIWSRPIRVEATSVEVRLTLRGTSDQVTYEVAGAGRHGKGVLVMGDRAATAPVLDLSAIEADCDRVITSDELYGRFDGVGLHYGPSMRVVDQVRTDGHQALSRLTGAIPVSAEGCLLHPAWMDAGLQTAAVTVVSDANRKDRLLVPFSVRQIDLYDLTLPVVYAHAELQPSSEEQDERRVHISLLDEAGTVVVHLEELCLKPYPAEASETEEMRAWESVEPSPEESILYRPCWRWQPKDPGGNPDECPAATMIVFLPASLQRWGDSLSARYPRHRHVLVELGDLYEERSPDHFVVCRRDAADFHRVCAQIDAVTDVVFLGGWQNAGIALTQEWLTRDEELGVLSLLYAVQALSACGCKDEPIRLHVMTCQAQHILASDSVVPSAGALQGLSKAIAREIPGWQVVCVDYAHCAFPSDADALHGVGSFGPERQGSVLEMGIRGGHHFVRGLQPVRLPPPSDDALPFRDRGVYLVVGGSGGIGLEVSKLLATRYHARVVLLGRSADDTEKQRQIEALEALQGEAMYVSADVTDLEAMRGALALVHARFGPVHGVIHAAVVLCDRPLEQMDESSFRAAMDVKARGAVVLHECMRSEPLDFMVFFSSGNSLLGSVGQTNYVAGCGFQDTYARHIQAEGEIPVWVINWGLWGETGIVASPEYVSRIARMGVHALSTEEGLNAFLQVMGSSLRQTMPIKLSRDTMEALGVDRSEFTRWNPSPAPLDLDRLLQQVPGRLPAKEGRDRQDTALLKRIVSVAATWLLHPLEEMGAVGTAGKAQSLNAWCEREGVSGTRRRLLHAAFGILARAGHIDGDLREGTSLLRSGEPSTENDRIEAEATLRGIAETHPEVASYVDLLEACLHGFADVVQGRRQGSEILFPHGSMDLLERVYKDNPSADAYNRVMAACVKAALEDPVPPTDVSRPFRILEVGAGVGGTSSSVLAALAPHAERVEYWYTDLSQTLVDYGERTYGDPYSFCRFKQLDIEQDIAAQGWEPMSFDLVLAGHVLHATRRLPDTLERVKSLIRSNGLLLINEATAVEDYATLTFGLLDGWWHFTDEELRLPDSPLMDLPRWHTLLAVAGFHPIHVLDTQGMAADATVRQAIFLARSDGVAVLRQPPELPIVAKEIRPPSPAQPLPPRRSELVEPGDLAGLTFEQVEASISEAVVNAFQLDPSDLDLNRPFSEFGADSIVSVELIEAVNQALGLSLKTTVLFDHPTIRELAVYVHAHGFPAPSRIPAAGEVAPTVESREPDVPRYDVAARVSPVRALEEILAHLESGDVAVNEALSEVARLNEESMP